MFTLLLANVFHGIVGLVWLAGMRRAAGPLHPTLHARLLVWSLVLPVLLVVVRVLGLVGPAAHRVLRVDVWSSQAAEAGWSLLLPLYVLFAGSVALCALQEVWPAWRAWRRPRHVERQLDPELDARLGRLWQRKLTELGVSRGRAPSIARLESDEPIAALVGLVHPIILVSRGLIARLDSDELDATIAHELGHLQLGGNLRMLQIWCVRLVQAPNPAALVLFRQLIEVQEQACDAVAVRLTKRPAALSSALLATRRLSAAREEPGSAVSRARQEVLEHAERGLTKARVRALLRDGGATSVSALVGAVVLLGGLLWAIG